MYFDYLNALVFAAVGFVFVFANLVLASILRPKRKTDVGLETYECGEEPDGVAWVRFHPRYYVVALIFVLFDVETVFILPWALNIRPLGSTAIIEMVLFMGILLLGWLYAVRKGAIKWQ